MLYCDVSLNTRNIIMATVPEKKTFEERFDMLMQSLEESNKAADKRVAEADKRYAEYEKARKESNAEWEKRNAEAKKEAEELRKNFEALGKYVKSVCGDLEGMKRSNGMFAEETIYNALAKDKVFGGIKFDDIDRNIKLHLKFLGLKAEFDVVLENGDTLAIIEAKYKVRREDVSAIIKQPDNFRSLFPEYSNYKIVLGIGGLCFDNDVIEDAKNQGIGIIKVDNDTIEYHTNNLKKY